MKAKVNNRFSRDANIELVRLIREEWDRTGGKGFYDSDPLVTDFAMTVRHVKSCMRSGIEDVDIIVSIETKY